MTVTIKRRFSEVTNNFVEKSAHTVAEILELISATEELLSFNAKCDITLNIQVGDGHNGNKAYN